MPTLESIRLQLLSILAAVQRLQAMQPYSMPRKEKLYQTAKGFLGTDASPNDVAPDELGCAESVSRIVQQAFPTLRFPLFLGTRFLYAHLFEDGNFRRVETPEYGDIIISPTGMGNGKLSSGHTGIVGKYGVLSNDSRSGLFLENYSIASWKLYFHGRGGFPTYFFRIV